jgi:hypothetical protein
MLHLLVLPKFLVLVDIVDVHLQLQLQTLVEARHVAHELSQESMQLVLKSGLVLALVSWQRQQPLCWDPQVTLELLLHCLLRLVLLHAKELLDARAHVFFRDTSQGELELLQSVRLAALVGVQLHAVLLELRVSLLDALAIKILAALQAPDVASVKQEVLDDASLPSDALTLLAPEELLSHVELKQEVLGHLLLLDGIHDGAPDLVPLSASVHVAASTYALAIAREQVPSDVLSVPRGEVLLMESMSSSISAEHSGTGSTFHAEYLRRRRRRSLVLSLLFELIWIPNLDFRMSKVLETLLYLAVSTNRNSPRSLIIG